MIYPFFFFLFFLVIIITKIPARRIIIPIIKLILDFTKLFAPITAPVKKFVLVVSWISSEVSIKSPSPELSGSNSGKQSLDSILSGRLPPTSTQILIWVPLLPFL